MKSIEEIKKEVAKENGFNNWFELSQETISSNGILGSLSGEKKIVNEVAQRHSQQFIDTIKELVEMLEFIFYKTNFQAHFPTTSIKVKSLLSIHTTHYKGKEGP